MNYSIINPCDELQDIISHYWEGKWDKKTSDSNELYYVIASSTTDITFAFSGYEKNDELLFSVVHGHTLSPLQTTVQGYFHLLGVSLYSYAIPTLFNISAFDLNEEYLPLTTFLGNKANDLNEKISVAETTDQRIKILNDFFIRLRKERKQKDIRMINAVKEVRRNNGNPKIIELASNSFLSQKQFNRRFKDFSGFNPKAFARVIRFETSLKNFPFFTNLTDLAHSSGYFDQAHFIREFKEFTGFSPSEYWKLSRL